MSSIVLQELSSPGCHNCEAFKTFWDEEKKNWPNVEFHDVSIMAPEGQELVQKHSIFASPGIIINGELFSTGGVNKDDFLAKLRSLSAG